MNQKVLGIAFLMVAMLLMAAFAAGENYAEATAGSNSVGQTVTLTVKNSNQNGSSNGTQSYTHNTRGNIALKVTPTAITMTTDGYTNPLGGKTAYSGIGPDNDNINVKNAGNVHIDVLVRSASTQFSDGSSNLFDPIAFTINSQDGSSVNILTVNWGIAENMPENGAGSNFNTHLTLDIPFYVHSGNYQNPLTYTAIESN